jgi:hypothetical protein
VKTNELNGSALNWAVAKCEGFEPCEPVPQFTENWAWGGPIIERERIELEYDIDNKQGSWKGITTDEDNCYFASGPTPLIAALRCYVASKLGNEVEIPEELK